MADRYLDEFAIIGVTNPGFLLEDGSGVLILEAANPIVYTKLEPAIRGLNRGVAEGGGY